MASPIRILHLIEDLGSGGAERLLYVNLSRLNRAYFDSRVCHLYDRALYWRQPILDLGYPVTSLGMTSLYDGGSGLWGLWRLLQQEPVDVIHTHLYGANLIGRVAARFRKVPIISSLHNPDYESAVLQDNPALSPAKLGLLRWLDRAACRLSRPEFVAVSEYVRQSAIQHLGIPAEKTRVIYNAVDVSYFQRTDESDVRLRAELGISPQDPVLLCVARLDPQKGLRYLIEALPMLVENFPRLQALFVGGGPPLRREALQKLADDLGVGANVQLLGVQPDVKAYLSAADVFVLPSLYEGLGIVLVEAMAMGCACVASNVGAIPEVVADGQSGFLVQPRNPIALAAAISRLLEDQGLRGRMGMEGRRIVLERFNVEWNIHQLEALYRSVARAS